MSIRRRKYSVTRQGVGTKRRGRDRQTDRSVATRQVELGKVEEPPSPGHWVKTIMEMPHSSTAGENLTSELSLPSGVWIEDKRLPG